MTLLLIFLKIKKIFFWKKTKKTTPDKKTFNNQDHIINLKPKDHTITLKPKDHKNLIDKPYKIQCNPDIFSISEFEILNKYGFWLSALTSGKIKAETNEQKLFIKECIEFKSLDLKNMRLYYKKYDAKKTVQKVWFKYLCRIKIESLNK